MAYHTKPVKVGVEGKKIYYRNDGTGRDTYVSRTNGGFVSRSLLVELQPHRTPNYTRMNFLTASNAYNTEAYH